MRTDLEHTLCLGCGELSPVGQGILAIASHVCPLSMVTYRPGRFKLSDLWCLFGGRNPMQSFKDLLVFPHFEKMPEGLDYMERFIYSLERDMEIKQMKRLRKYIELEQEFYDKW